MSHYPLFVATRDVVFGNGFVAEVSTLGRALYDDGEGEFWLYGVNPGGVAGNGDSLTAANLDYQKAVTGVLFDIAADTSGFDDFEAAVRRFFDDVNTFREKEWLGAVALKDQQGNLGLQTTAANTAPTIVVQNKTEKFSPSDNMMAENNPALAAAA